MIPDFSILDEIDMIKDKVGNILDPALRVKACGEALAQLRDLITWLGPYGERGDAAQEALKFYGLETAAAMAGVTPNTLNRLAGR